MALTILALDTSTEACSVALLKGTQITAEFIVSQREHTKRILPMVDQILATAQCQLTELDAIAFGCGPGSFTGVRIGIGIAQGLALGADKPLLAVSTLATLAQGAYRLTRAKNVVAAIDARMNEVYLGQYELMADDDWVCLQEKVIKPEQVASAIKPFSGSRQTFFAGTGWQTYPDMLPDLSDSGLLLPHAQDMLPLAKRMWHNGEITPIAEVEPTYLRNEVTWKKLPGR
ncbi:tRNA (adenosine(37)-N6)-threonylcarbamoyltransferase complex dimerization subunit type 1 TsaB [Utexia brackfieldae]|uniref:tRNA (adenosine(37)-N6)-threonylcarbamoyltransferase complex dimerization subunit type 1 TsaB n=1 Tax=Utexia brackfieldae TaxID=3074108 RepID=UPI00370DA8F8